HALRCTLDEIALRTGGQCGIHDGMREYFTRCFPAADRQELLARALDMPSEKRDRRAGLAPVSWSSGPRQSSGGGAACHQIGLDALIPHGFFTGVLERAAMLASVRARAISAPRSCDEIAAGGRLFPYELSYRHPVRGFRPIDVALRVGNDAFTHDQAVRIGAEPGYEGFDQAVFRAADPDAALEARIVLRGRRVIGDVKHVVAVDVDAARPP